MRTLLLKSLLASPVTIDGPAADDAGLEEIGRVLAARARRLFGRSMTIREVDAGSCNGCELEIHALNNAVYDVERFGLKFAASPRHADVLLVTGPVTRNMKVALERTYRATPGRRLRLRLRRVRGQLRRNRCHGQRDPGRPAHSRLSAAADRSPARPHRAYRPGGGAGATEVRRRRQLN
jgi:hypothetical protein